jgi:glutaredoxin
MTFQISIPFTYISTLKHSTTEPSSRQSQQNGQTTTPRTFSKAPLRTALHRHPVSVTDIHTVLNPQSG